MGAIDLAGVIGTWVAAALGIIALVGIIGPILVWRASRTDQHKALDALEKTNTDFISKGYKAGPKIRLGRKIKAPILTGEPSHAIRNVVWNPASKMAVLESPSWVKLGLILKAYGLDYQVGDSVSIEDQVTLLPVHRTWILLLGIVGGFARRPDEEKIGQLSKAQPAIPGACVNSLRRDQPTTPGWMTTRIKWARGRDGSAFGESVSDGQYEYSPLYGLAATLYTRSGTWPEELPEKQKAFLSLHSVEEAGDLPRYPIPLSHLIWFAVGCIQTAEGKVFSLEDVTALAPAAQAEIEVDYSRPVTPAPPAHGMGRGVHFDRDESDEDNPFRQHNGFGRNINTPNTYITPTLTPMDPRRHGNEPLRVSGIFSTSNCRT